MFDAPEAVGRIHIENSLRFGAMDEVPGRDPAMKSEFEAVCKHLYPNFGVSVMIASAGISEPTSLAFPERDQEKVPMSSARPSPDSAK